MRVTGLIWLIYDMFIIHSRISSMGVSGWLFRNMTNYITLSILFTIGFQQSVKLSIVVCWCAGNRWIRYSLIPGLPSRLHVLGASYDLGDPWISLALAPDAALLPAQVVLTNPKRTSFMHVCPTPSQHAMLENIHVSLHS
jgi:hypothetical protein